MAYTYKGKLRYALFFHNVFILWAAVRMTVLKVVVG